MRKSTYTLLTIAAVGFILTPVLSFAASFFFVDDEGNVGIGNSDPQHRLDVSGALYSRLIEAESLSIDWNEGNVQKLTLTGSSTLSFLNGQAGGEYKIILNQDSTGGRSVTWPTTVAWAEGVPPTLTSAADSIDLISFLYDGNNYLGSYALDFQPSFLARENFQSYSDSVSLNGLNGGQGWSGAWSVTNGNNYSINSTITYSGNRAAKYAAAAADDNSAQRSFSGQTSGILQFYTYKAANNTMIWSPRLLSGGGLKVLTYFNQSGNITAYDNLTERTIQSYSANTWYKVAIKFDCNTDTYQIAINDGSFTSSYDFYNGATCSTIDTIQFMKQNTGTDVDAYFDDILLFPL